MSQDNSKANDRIEVRKEYYTSGALYSETPYENGKRHGIRRIYYKSGALYWEVPFVNGKEHGTEKEYYMSGALWHETPFVNGNVHGIKKEYEKPTSSIVRLTLYDKDRRVSSVKI